MLFLGPWRIGYFRSPVNVYVEQVAKYRLSDNQLVMLQEHCDVTYREVSLGHTIHCDVTENFRKDSVI